MKCENCGQEYDNPTYGTGRFCCASCRAAYTNKQRKLSDITKQKISQSLKKYYKKDNKNIVKKYFCGS